MVSASRKTQASFSRAADASSLLRMIRGQTCRADRDGMRRTLDTVADDGQADLDDALQEALTASRALAVRLDDVNARREAALVHCAVSPPRESRLAPTGRTASEPDACAGSRSRTGDAKRATAAARAATAPRVHANR
jgi:hypothetical protein